MSVFSSLPSSDSMTKCVSQRSTKRLQTWQTANDPTSYETAEHLFNTPDLRESNDALLSLNTIKKASDSTTEGSVTSLSPKLGPDMMEDDLLDSFDNLNTITFQCDPRLIVDEGIYLTFSPVANGTMHLNWSRQPLFDALAYAKPATPVPSFRYNNTQRKEELSTGVQRSKTGIASAWCSFLKVARQYQSTVWLLPNPNVHAVHVFVMKRNNKLLRLVPNRGLTITGDIVAVAAVPQVQTFLGINQMDATVFLQQANTAEGGWGLSLI